MKHYLNRTVQFEFVLRTLLCSGQIGLDQRLLEFDAFLTNSAEKLKMKVSIVSMEWSSFSGDHCISIFQKLKKWPHAKIFFFVTTDILSPHAQEYKISIPFSIQWWSHPHLWIAIICHVWIPKKTFSSQRMWDNWHWSLYVPFDCFGRIKLDENGKRWCHSNLCLPSRGLI